MFKKFPWFTVLATLVAWMLFWEVKETLSGDRMFFVYRWLYSNMAHAKNIEVKTYLLTDEQVATMVAHPNTEIAQLTRREIGGKNMNVVLRLRGKKGGLAWGRLSWKVEGMGWRVVDVDEIPTPGKTKKYADVIIPVGTLAMEREDSLPEPIEVKWEVLYVYR